MIKSIRLLCELFIPHCQDTETMRRIADICLAVEQYRDHPGFADAWAIFEEVRGKSQRKANLANEAIYWQYLFEEKCAKSLYNMPFPPAPFDPDSPFYIVPFALAFGRVVGIPDSKILEIVMH